MTETKLFTNWTSVTVKIWVCCLCIIVGSFITIGLGYMLVTQAKDASAAHIIYWEGIGLILVPFALWLLARIRFRISSFAKKKKAEENILTAKSDDDRLLTETAKLIHYFGLLGRDVSKITINTVQGIEETKPKDGVPPATPVTIASTIAALQIKIKDDGVKDANDKALLAMIHDYLSAELTCCTTDDNSVTVETIDEAVNADYAKLRILDYVAGALYFLIVTIVLQSYTNRLDNDRLDTKRADSTYRAYVAAHSAELIKKDSTRLANNDTIIKSDSFFIDTLKLYKSILNKRISFIESDISYYPFLAQTENTSGKDTTGNAFILERSDAEIYAAGQLVDDLSKFILPMLYGLLGAYLYVIRTIAKQVKVFDLTWKKMIRHRARLIFGLFVGMFFGYMYKTSGMTSAYTVTPFVLALVGGYQVELLFTILDKIVTTFTSTGDTPARKTGDDGKGK